MVVVVAVSVEVGIVGYGKVIVSLAASAPIAIAGTASIFFGT